MNEHAGSIIDLYERHAHAFDKDRTRSATERPWLGRFLALIPHGGRILDLGCGMGEPIAKTFVDVGHRVTGVDSSPSMIALCRERFPDQRWQVADMRCLALGERFDGIVAWDSFFHLTPDDQRAMFPIFRDHAADGAALMFTSGPQHGEALASYQGEPLYHASLAPEEYRTLLAGNGFAVVAFVPEDPQCWGHTVWLARRSAPPAADDIV